MANAAAVAGKNSGKNTPTRRLANYLFWLLILQGLSLILLGILVLAYPPAVVILVSITLLWNGVTAIIMAVRVKKYRRELREILSE